MISKFWNNSKLKFDLWVFVLRLDHQVIYTLNMKKLERILQWQKFLEYQSFRWAFVGIVTNSIDYLLFLLIFYRFNFVSTLIATSLNYAIHHRWTFKTSQTLVKSGLKYFINLFLWWSVSTTMIKFLIEIGLDPRVSKLIPFVVIIPLNFFILKLYVFKK